MLGSLIPWAKWVGAGLGVLAIVLGIYLYGREQYGQGVDAEAARWLMRENAELAAANAKIIQATTAARQAEHAAADRLAAVSAGYQKELKNERDKTSKLAAAARAGTLVLRDPAASAFQACADGMPEAAATAGGHPGQAPGQLSGAAAEFLLNLSGEADAVARQLEACQQVIQPGAAE